jgi:methionyl-tRNA formyltransferase
VLRAVRAFDDSFGAYTFMRSPAGDVKRVRLVAAARAPSPLAARAEAVLSQSAPRSASAAHAGAALYLPDVKRLLLRCADGWLALDTLHVEQRAPVSATQFAAGYKVGAGPRGDGTVFTFIDPPGPALAQ